MAPTISQAAIDLIVAEEVSDRATYERRYRRPEWPEGASGVTIGIGYDVGYANRFKLESDWKGHIPDAMIAALTSAIGVHGATARPLAKSLGATVDVPWDAAMAVFMGRDVPEWIGTVCKHLPNTDALSPDCLGALVSLAYNRGPSFDEQADRSREMRAIKAHMAAKEFDKIPGEFRSMKRIWPGVRGLQNRREHEARLFEQGLRGARPADGTLRYGDHGYEVEAMQRRLSELGYTVGATDGVFGTGTRAAVLAFQADRNLPTTGVVDAATRSALAEEVARPVSEARENATADDLREAGSTTVKKADGVGMLGKVVLAGGGVKGLDATGALDKAKDAADQLGTLRSTIEALQSAAHWALSYWWVGALAVGFLAWYYGRGIIAARIADHQSGKSMGR